ncbi:helix-turn-helix domain-containing protein [Streptomyces sp. V1I6]|uniref:helix-turn-helix domain-containing protein n=1 Tax=Streptomyces sp. V1I6 TaxID=3042273 RepID=UPI0027D8F0B0|nr:helix-turn-helix transcriptional regulator [Streptomyces sp. V1I6]
MSRIVGQNIKRLREARRMSGQQLAALVQEKGQPLSRFAVSQIELGRNSKGTPRAVTVDDLVALAVALEVRPEQLLIEPSCVACFDAPPAGFACRSCGAAA